MSNSEFSTSHYHHNIDGVGTGLLTSLVVSVIEKRKKDEKKRSVLNDIIEISIDVYEDVIYRINEYIERNRKQEMGQLQHIMGVAVFILMKG